MLPYLSAPAIRIGEIGFDLSGILAGAGVLIGHFAFLRNAQSFGFERGKASRLSFFLMIGGLIGALLFSIWVNGRQISSLADWRTRPPAISSLGAISGATLVALGWSLRNRLTLVESMRWLDAAALAFPAAWLLVRAACILQHDHPGIRTDGWFAVPYPDWPRYDLAFLEFLFLIPVVIGFELFRRRPLPAGAFAILLLVLYGGLRLLIEPLRVDPVRYWGVSVDQWTVAVFAGLGIAVMSRMQFHPKRRGVE